MTITYDDLYVRDAFDDRGDLPYGGRTAYLSPDIIPQQQNQREPRWFIDNYGKDQGLNVIADVNNYVYVRAKNLKTTSTSGTVFLYCAPSTLLLNVNYWSNNPINIGNGAKTSASLVDANNNTQIAPDQICVGQTPFLLNQPIPDGFHYCLITRVVTGDHGNPIPVGRFTSSGDFLKWVVENPNVAWRNVTTVPSTTGAISQSQYYENPDPSEQTYWFVVQGTDFPDGSTVTIEGLTAGNTFSYTGRFGAPPLQTALTMQGIPAGFAGTVNVTVTPPSGQSIPSGATLYIQYYRQIQQGDHPTLIEHAVPADALPFDPEVLARHVGNASTPSITGLGECVILVKS
jgi:hypothetical protein